MINAKTYAQALFEAVSESKPKDHDIILENFVKILNENADLGLYDQIEAEYQKLEMQSKGVKKVELTTASNVNAKKIIEELNDLIGGKAEIQHKIDQKIIGGVVLRVDDTLIDASIKTSLEKLKKVIAQ